MTPAAGARPDDGHGAVPAPHARRVRDGDARYQQAYRAVAAAVAAAFPDARPVEAHGMPGWMAPRPPEAPRPARGTFDPDHVFVGLADRKAGPTLHVWHPGDPGLLDRHADALRAAGFKVMVGCLPYARQGPYPQVAVARLLADAAAVDGARASRP